MARPVAPLPPTPHLCLHAKTTEGLHISRPGTGRTRLWKRTAKSPLHLWTVARGPKMLPAHLILEHADISSATSKVKHLKKQLDITGQPCAAGVP